ncbi:MAG: hypothetical protein AAB774_01755 [Patescibacteria group bacterium]
MMAGTFTLKEILSGKIPGSIGCPFPELCNEIPDQLHILKHEPTARFGCYCHHGVHGLAVFSTEVSAFRFAEWIDLSGMVCLEVSFDESREIAKERPMPIVSVMLLDDIQKPKIHYVR